jgi:predicted nucleotidyltransferase
MKINPIEGDLFEDLNGIIFDVKGLVYPPNKVIAFPRFVPDSSGNRKHEGVAYKKIYALSTRFKFLERKFPQYIVYDPIFDEWLCEIPFENVKEYYKPVDRLQELRLSNELDELEMCALKFFKHLKDHVAVPWSKIGISGSLLTKLHTPNSDIDPIVYGSENCRNVYEALKAMPEDAESVLRFYSNEELKELFRFRFQGTRVSFNDFVRTESRKVLQGKFEGRDYFMRFVKDWNEAKERYGTIRYKNVGYAKIRAEIEDDSKAIFTPNSYKIRNVNILEGVRFPIEEIASFRGRFCEQAKKGEVVIAQGKVERVTDRRQNREYFRLLLGNKPSDYIILA